MSQAPILIIDIDGLRPDVFQSELQAGRLPHLARLFGGPGLERGLLHPAVAPAPSITFASQASLFTGQHPAQHGVPGNQFYDRFGRQSRGVPRHYAFDVGDTLAADDAVLVFSSGLASGCLQTPTIYEQLGRRGWKTLVIGHMYARGATQWIKPNLAHLAQLTKGRSFLHMSAEEFDRQALKNALEALSRQGMPDLMTLYFMGLDHESHAHGPAAQADYLSRVLDGLIGELWDALCTARAGKSLPLVALCSDHGQRRVPSDDHHSLRLAFPFERELGHLFDALGLDVHDYPGEDPNCDAVVASNGPLAHVYLQNRRGRWSDPPVFERDVLPVARAFWEAHRTGRYASELEGALAGVLVRDIEKAGWDSSYLALTPGGELVSLSEWFASMPDGLYLDPVHRINNLASPVTGELLLLSNDQEGFYFGAPTTGIHGGLHPEDSSATLAYGWPDSPLGAWEPARAAIQSAIARRCQQEDGRMPSTADLWTGLQVVLDGKP